MAEPRVLTEEEAFRLLAHLIATAELHTIEPPHYAGRRIVEGTLPLIDAMMRDGDSQSQAWLQDFRLRLEAALTARRSDATAFETFLHAAPGEIIREIKRRHGAGTSAGGSDDVTDRPG
jgi:hypothetical protein